MSPLMIARFLTHFSENQSIKEKQTLFPLFLYELYSIREPLVDGRRFFVEAFQLIIKAEGKREVKNDRHGLLMK